MSTRLVDLPDELLSLVESFLTWEDSMAYQQTCRRLRYATKDRMMFFDKMQISDDANGCLLSDSRNRRPPLSFLSRNAPRILSTTTSLQEINILMKEVDLLQVLRSTECSPYSSGGYLGPLLMRNLHCLSNVRQLSLHVDMMVETIKDTSVCCPVEDLSFALQLLSNAPFRTFVQISICCGQYDEDDFKARNDLISGMENTLKTAAQLGATTDFVVEPAEGYVDMTVEKDNFEYSFAFFYYNPSICEAATSSDSEDMFVDDVIVHDKLHPSEISA